MSNENLIKRLQDWSDGPDTDDLCREAADALTAQANSLGFLRQISEQQAYEINQQAAEIEALRADLISCRGTVKTELHHYERLGMVHGKTPHGESYWLESQRLANLLDRIDAIDAAMQSGKAVTP